MQCNISLDDAIFPTAMQKRLFSSQ